MATVTLKKILGLNMMEYLPTNYDPKRPYPCLIFLPGAGEIGTNAALLANHGPFQYLKAGVDLGKDLIVLAIQNVHDNPQPAEVQQYVTAVRAAYNITGIVATGLSRGGQDWDWFICAAESNLSQIKALAMFSSQGPVTDSKDIPASWQPALLKKYGIFYWFGCGDQDSNYDGVYGMLGREKSLAAIAPELTGMEVWKGVGHGDPVWADAYRPGRISPVTNTDLYDFAIQRAGRGSVVVPTIYQNVAASKSFTRNNCGTGTGSAVVYSVAAGKYSSVLSQADADNQAATDISANGQAYANANGTCTPVKIVVLTVNLSDGKHFTLYSDGTYLLQ